MTTEIFAVFSLCLTIAASVGGCTWILAHHLGKLSAQIEGVKGEMSVRMDGMNKRISHLETVVESINDFLRRKGQAE